MISFSSTSDISELKSKFTEIHQSLADRLEEECVILYPPVVERLKKASIEPTE